MPKFNYIALDKGGKETKGTIEAASQNEAIGRVKDMSLFPTKIVEAEKEEKLEAVQLLQRDRRDLGPAPSR